MNELHLSNPYFINLINFTRRLSDSGQFMVNINLPIKVDYPVKGTSNSQYSPMQITPIMYNPFTFEPVALFELFTYDSIFNNCMTWRRDDGDHILLSSFECFNKILYIHPFKKQIHRKKIFGYE